MTPSFSNASDQTDMSRPCPIAAHACLSGERLRPARQAEPLRPEADRAGRDDDHLAPLPALPGDRLDEAVEPPEGEGAVVAHDDVRPDLHDDAAGGRDAGAGLVESVPGIRALRTHEAES